MALHVAKDTRDCCKQVCHSREEAVVRSGLAGVLPQALSGIQLRTVGGQLMDIQPVPI